MTRDFCDLVAITQARFQAEQAKLRDILEQEQRLRQKAKELEEHHRAAQTQYQSDITGQQVYGGDVLWQGWIARSRRCLQIELAQVLMRKGQMIRTMQNAHGRKLASEALEKTTTAQRRKEREKVMVEHEQSLALMKKVPGKTRL